MEIKSSLTRIFKADGYRILPILKQVENSLAIIEGTNDIELLVLFDIKEQIQTLKIIYNSVNQQIVLVTFYVKTEQ